MNLDGGSFLKAFSLQPPPTDAHPLSSEGGPCLLPLPASEAAGGRSAVALALSAAVASCPQN